MPSDGQVRVTRLFGTDAVVGSMDPKVGMVTQQGTVMSVKGSGSGGNTQVSVSGVGCGNFTDYYPHQLRVSLDVASGVFSYPSGDGAAPFGHHGLYPSGDVPSPISNQMAFATGAALPSNFTR